MVLMIDVEWFNMINMSLMYEFKLDFSQKIIKK